MFWIVSQCVQSVSSARRQWRGLRTETEPFGMQNGECKFRSVFQCVRPRGGSSEDWGLESRIFEQKVSKVTKGEILERVQCVQSVSEQFRGLGTED